MYVDSYRYIQLFPTYFRIEIKYLSNTANDYTQKFPDYYPYSSIIPYHLEISLYDFSPLTQSSAGITLKLVGLCQVRWWGGYKNKFCSGQTYIT